MLIVFGGLPGTGKTTVSRRLAERLAATHLRIDLIEQAIRAAGVLAGDVGPAGYGAAQALAISNLTLGRTVIADCVNPVAASRAGWKAVAGAAAVRLVEIEVVCSDPVEHRRRVETRGSDIAGLTPPSWAAVLQLAFEPWDRAHLVLDTSRLTLEDAIEMVERHIGCADRSAQARSDDQPRSSTSGGISGASAGGIG